LVDECCHRRVANALRIAGHDVRYAAETDIRAPDTSLALIATEERRVIITADSDFGELARRFTTDMPGVILIAPTRRLLGDLIDRILQLIMNPDLPVQNHLTIVEDGRIRSSPLKRD